MHEQMRAMATTGYRGWQHNSLAGINASSRWEPWQLLGTDVPCNQAWGIAKEEELCPARHQPGRSLAKQKNVPYSDEATFTLDEEVNIQNNRR